MSDRALFTYNPNLIQDDENLGGEDLYQIIKENVPEPTKVIKNLNTGEVIGEKIDFV